MSSQVTETSAQAARLEQRIKEHKEEMARLREKYGDPAAALDKFMRDRFTLDALLAKDDRWDPDRRAIWEQPDSDDW